MSGRDAAVIKRRMRWVRLGLLSALVLAAVLVVPRLDWLEVGGALRQGPTRPLLAVLMLLALHCVKAVVMVIPMAALYVASGVLFGPYWAVPVTYFCLFAELVVGYGMGRLVGREAVNELLGRHERMARMLRLDGEGGPAAVVAARISPLSFDLISMLCGALDMSFWRYIGFSMVGLSPTMIPFVMAGGAVDTIWSPRFLVPFLLCLAVSAVTLLLHRRRARRA